MLLMLRFQEVISVNNSGCTHLSSYDSSFPWSTHTDTHIHIHTHTHTHTLTHSYTYAHTHSHIHTHTHTHSHTHFLTLHELTCIVIKGQVLCVLCLCVLCDNESTLSSSRLYCTCLDLVKTLLTAFYSCIAWYWHMLNIDIVNIWRT